MHGAMMARSTRRIQGKPSPDYVAVGIPTAERLAKAHNHFTIGDDKQGTRIYQFHDTTINKLYSRLARRAKGKGEEDSVRSEFFAFERYKEHWYYGGLELALSSMDMDRVFASDPSSISGMAKTERQAHHRKQYREAVKLLGWKTHILVENIVCASSSLENAGWSIGMFNSRTSARDGAERILRESGRKLAKLWGIS